MIKVFFFYLFLFSFSSQAHLFIIDSGVDITQYDWLHFINPKSIKAHKKDREKYLEKAGSYFIASSLYIDKLQLSQLKKELYKPGFSGVDFSTAIEAIKAYKANIEDLEMQISTVAGIITPVGLGEILVPTIRPYSNDYEGVWWLYKEEYKIIFDFLEKVDEEFYQALGSDDERYAGYILPYVMDYIRKSQKMTKAYTTVLERAYKNPEYYKEPYIVALNVMALRSRELYKCFIKNFQNLEGENQRALREAMTAWYNEQSLSGAKGLITEYELFNTKPSIVGLPHSVVSVLVGYAYDGTPEVVREKLEPFFRAVLTDDRLKAGFSRTSAFLNALIGLENLKALTPDEEKIFKRAEELGGIRTSPENPTLYWSLPTLDLKEILSI